jgi:diguanylate cyclase (GGDEF)-like protein/PAS domain S-box-containing protein
MWLVVALGALATAVSVFRLPILNLGLQFLFVALVTIIFGSRVTIRFPFFKSAVSIADIFLFLTMMLFGGEAAVLLSALESYAASFRVSKKHLTRAFNGAAMALSTFITVQALRLLFGPIQKLTTGEFTSKIAIAMSVMAIVQYLVNSGLVAVAASLRMGQPVLKIWKEHYLWTCITYFAGATAAVMTARMVHQFGFTAFIAVTPLVAFVYFTYVTYLKNIESSKAQAEQAERHMVELQKSEERFRSAFGHAPIGMALVGADGHFLQVNQSLSDSLGYSEEELRETNFQAITHPEDLATFLPRFTAVLAGQLPSWQMEKRYFHQTGREVWTLVGISLTRDAQSNTPSLIFQIQDITDRKHAEEKLLHDALHDALTGMPNRLLFMDHLRKALERAKRNKHRFFAVLFIDLDRFKIINDSLGHQAGDELLIEISRRLRSSTRKVDTVARLGGDEFTILLEDLTELGRAIEVAERVQQAVSQPLVLGGQAAYTTASIGIALYNPDYQDHAAILRDADTAMYQAKANGKARYEIFNERMHEHVLKRLKLETEMRQAIERGEFYLLYQPIVSLQSGLFSGFEALIRWRQADGTVISPADFIPIAEETGLIVPIGYWVIQEAARQMREWQEKFPLKHPLSVSVNLSGKQLADANLIEQIIQIIHQTGLNPNLLKLEITESIVMEKIETAISMLKRLRNLGIRLSIDDFGTGYSSLSYLPRLPIDTLKIDRSFVGQMLENNEHAEVVKAVVSLAKALGMQVVAEGVETREQVRQLQLLQCEHGQGFLFSRPVEAEAAGKLIHEMQQADGLPWIREFQPEEGWDSAVSTYTM